MLQTTAPNDQKDEHKQSQNDHEDAEFEICTAHDLFNSFVHHTVIIDIRSSDEYLKSHIYDAINIDPATIDKPNKHIHQAKFGRNIAIYGPKDITKNYMNIVQFIITKFVPRTVKIFNDGYDTFKQNYPFLCAAHGCDSKFYPSCIIPNKLYLGRQSTRFSGKALANLNITHIVDVTTTQFPVNDKIQVLKLALHDSEDEDIHQHFDTAIAFMDKAFKSNDAAVFVHCQMGVSRSTTIILSWLMKSKGYTLFDAYRLCHKCRPIIHPNDGFFNQLVKYETEIYDKSTENEIKALKLREKVDCLVM